MADERRRLIDFLPHFMQNVSEIRALLQSANIETDSINTDIEGILDEAYIDSCTDYGLRKYENLLHIIPADDESLETRKMRVKMRWYDYCPYSLRVLISKLNMICGVNEYDLQGDYEDYYFKLITELSSYGSVDELSYMLESILPQNMFYESINNLNIKSECNINYAGGTVFADIYELTQDFKDDQSIMTDFFIGGGVVFAEKQLLTQDFNDNQMITGDSYIGGGIVSSDVHIITQDFNESATMNGDVNYAAGIVEADIFEINN